MHVQFCERLVEILLPSIPGSALCPTAAVTNASRFTVPVLTRGLQAFSWVDDSRVLHVFTHTRVFLNRVHMEVSGFGRLVEAAWPSG